MLAKLKSAKKNYFRLFILSCLKTWQIYEAIKMINWTQALYYQRCLAFITFSIVKHAVGIHVFDWQLNTTTRHLLVTCTASKCCVKNGMEMCPGLASHSSTSLFIRSYWYWWGTIYQKPVYCLAFYLKLSVFKDNKE